MTISNFGKRLLTSSVLVLYFLGLFLLRAYVANVGIYLFDVTILVAAAIGTWEICNVKNLNKRGANAYVVMVIYALVYMFFIIGSVILETPLPWWLQLFISFLIIGIFCLFIGLSNMLDKNMAKTCRLEKKNFNKEAWGGAWDLFQMVLYPGMLFACGIVMNHMTTNNMGLFGLLLVLFISCLTDVFAYCVGMVLGKGAAKMAPKISPKKTWIGFVGGLFGGILGALSVVWIISGNAEITNHLIATFDDAILVQLLFIIIGLIGSVITALGDLFASWVKRRHDVKDFGHIFPGHGGVMDRVDGIIFNLPFILLIMGII